MSNYNARNGRFYEDNRWFCVAMFNGEKLKKQIRKLLLYPAELRGRSRKRAKPSVGDFARQLLCPFAAAPSAAKMEAAQVDVKMIAMGGVEIGAEDHRKDSAGAVMDIVDEARFGIVTLPIRGDRRFLAVCEDETGDIERIGAGMLAHRGRRALADDRAADEAAELVDADHGAAEIAPRGRLDDMIDEHREIDGEGAGRNEPVVEAGVEGGRLYRGDALDVVQSAFLR